MDALMPLASLPMQISGPQPRVAALTSTPSAAIRNGRRLPAPAQSLKLAEEVLFFMSSNPVLRLKAMPDLAQSDAALDAAVGAAMRTDDANDTLYQLEASRDYDPGPELERIRAPLLAVNTADDLINPPELGVQEREIARVPHGRALLLPLGPDTRGHGTHTVASCGSRNWLRCSRSRRTEVATARARAAPGPPAVSRFGWRRSAAGCRAGSAARPCGPSS
jgi:homoserine O-acetyltransferase